MTLSGLNRRIHPRSLTDQRAEVVLHDCRVACVIRDRSIGGARLVFRHATALPGAFELDEGSLCHSVELVWFDGVQAGVRLLPDRQGPRSGPKTAAAP